MMNNFSKLLELQMRVNKLSRPKAAKLIGIPASALRRLNEGKPIRSSELITLVSWLFEKQPSE